MPNPNLPIAGNFNTYVGARYVPKFAEPMEWSANTQYEPLTIVSYNGNSYTSKTFPPVGTVPTNLTYWAPTGNYNAQIEQYRQETQAVKQELDEIQTDVENNTQNINIALKDVRYALYVGNSYTRGSGSPTLNGLFNRTKFLFQNAWQITDDGTGFLPYSNHPTTFITQLQSFIAQGNNLNLITDVFFISAYGDSRAYIENSNNWTNLTDNALNQAYILCKNNFPNLKRIMLVFAESRLQQIPNDGYNIPYYVQFRLNLNFRNLCYRQKMEYLGWIGWEILMRGAEFFSSDGYHPSDGGYNILADCLISAYFGSYSPYHKTRIYDKYPLAFTEGTIQLEIDMQPDHTTIVMPRMLLSNSSISQTARNDFTFIDFHNIDVLPFLGFAGGMLTFANIYWQTSQENGIITKGYFLVAYATYTMQFYPYTDINIDNNLYNGSVLPSIIDIPAGIHPDLSVH